MPGFGPLGSYPLGASGAESGVNTVAVEVYDGVSLAAAAENSLVNVVFDAMGMSSAVDAGLINVVVSGVVLDSSNSAVAVKYLNSNLRLAGKPRDSGEFAASAGDTVGFGGALVVVWQALIEENLSLVGELASQPTKVVRLVDGLVASGAVSSHTEGYAALAAALAINSLTATGWRAEASDQVNLQDAFQAQLIVATRLLDGIAAADTAAPSMRLTAVVDEGLALSDEVSVSLQYLETLGEDVLFFGAIRLGDDEYVGWVLNGGAPSEYRNYPFNGFTKFNGQYFGTADDGLYLLEGDDDAGEPIEARIKTALMDFGTGVLKRVPDVYVAFVGSDQLVLKVVTTGQRGEQVETIYTSTVPEGTALHNGRIRIGQGLKSRYWQFELSNVDGAEFEIDELAWRPMTLDRRL